ncbi:MAG: hypothetical protein HY567_01765 [Candidatus Kerfeldbacteria bacterium]|nr:hypothetical protein [Candidatus Kerfeldbacteria bacterium]
MEPEFLRGMSDVELVAIVGGNYPPELRKRVEEGELHSETVRGAAFHMLITQFTYQVQGSRARGMTLFDAIDQRVRQRLSVFPKLYVDPHTHEMTRGDALLDLYEALRDGRITWPPQLKQ